MKSADTELKSLGLNLSLLHKILISFDNLDDDPYQISNREKSFGPKGGHEFEVTVS